MRYREVIISQDQKVIAQFLRRSEEQEVRDGDRKKFRGPIICPALTTTFGAL